MGASAANLDFTNVKESTGFNQSRIVAGDYAAIISKVDDATAPDGTKAWVFAIKLKDKPSSVFRYYCKLDEKSLWKVRNLFIAAGKTVPKRRAKVDPNQVIGKLIGATIEDGEDYKDREQSEVTGVFPASELGDSTMTASADEDDDDDTTDDDVDLDDMDNSGPTFVPSDDEDEEAEEPEEAEDEAEEEAEEADPYADLDRTELKRRIKAIQADFKILTKHTDDDLKGFLAKLEADNGEDEEEAPAPKAAPKKRAPKPATEDISDEDLDDINIDDL